ncbi:golgi transport complex subunit Cog4 [Trichodelitschia bisporula]|uniref:Conserved oligomeric Golgi complex subunit 4 n=1 Tax=Trichodelitschia bisporula TaxID=703511 RepID=A0A6G1I2W1_9PEZI|nr:golgi transport complex subunit Cog4 [Trichodelitschia bisporula]
MDSLPNGTHTPDIYSATSIDEIHAALAHLSQREATVTAQLDSIISSQNDLSRELGRLDLLRAHLGSQVVSTRAISNGMLSGAAVTAHRISSAVKRLDQEQANVKATLEVVEQVSELKACVLGVHGSMGAPQDWETAAGYLNRASKIPAEVIDGSFAEEIVPTAEVPDPPRITLENAAESLCGLFLREFEKATQEGDGAKVARFFKLFPLIGRSQVGLDAYGRYVCQGVAAKARQNLNSGTGGNLQRDGYFYANSLTKLFEHIAQIVDGHEPLVEQHYGTGMMVKVIERLQIEADVQGGIILDTWSDERTISRKLTDIKSYAFSFLVQSFMPQKSASGITRSDSPAKPGQGGAPEEDGVNMKEVDGILGESAVMLGRWALYTRFLASKSSDSEHASLTMPPYLSESNLNKKMLKLVIEPFNAMTTFFFRRSVERAFQLDEAPADLTLNINKPLIANAPFITSAVDDVMYIVNQVLQRALATAQRPVIATTVPTIGRVLSSDFIGMIQRKMRDECYPKAAIQGALPPEDKIIAFMVLINNLDVATDYVKRIVATHLDGPDPEQAEGHFATLFPFANDAAFAAQTLKSLEITFATKCAELLGDGIQVTFHQVLKPRLRPILADAFRDAEYNLTSADREPRPEDDDDADPADVVPARFAAAWGMLTKPLRRILTPRAWDKLLAAALPYVASALEKRLWGLHGRVSELGTLRLERHVAGIVQAACGDGRYGLREAFARCVQLVQLAGMEAEEWEEVVDGEMEDEGVVWVLDKGERARARGLVVGRE